jgi:hypothetical protein
MPTETTGKPLPTPHPDAPRDSEPQNGCTPEPGPEPLRFEASDPEGPAYDSCLDEVDVVLSQPVGTPDPALQSNTPTPTDETARSPESGATACVSGGARLRPPRTSEVFQQLAPQAAGTDCAAAGSGARGLVSPTGGEGVAESVLAASPGIGQRSGGGVLRSTTEREDEAEDDEDRLGDVRLSWLIGLLLSYSSVVTLALGWLLWTGGARRSTDETATGKSNSSAELAAKPSEAVPSVLAPPIPEENLTSLGKPIRLGALELTPLEIVAAPVQLVRSIDRDDVRDAEADSLILRLHLTNISGNLVFAPLEAALVRDQASPLDRSYIATARGKRINLYPLAIDSEWLIAGQEFPVLDPGASALTLIASEPVTAGRPTGDMTWRLRLRTGPVRSDMVGVRFTEKEIRP